jgi:hypothetical protein
MIGGKYLKVHYEQREREKRRKTNKPKDQSDILSTC